MEIRQLKYYLQVCKDLNLSKAANHLFITQQALSQSMKNMEDELDAILFTRNNHGIVLTELGVLVKNDVEKCIHEYENLVNRIQHNTQSLKGSLKIAVPPGIAPSVLPPMLNGFSVAYPEVHLSILEVPDLDCEELLKTGQVDLAFSVLPVDKNDFDFIPLFSYCAYAFINKCSPLSRKATISFQDLKNENILLISDRFKWHYTIPDKFRSYGIEPKITQFSAQVDLLARLVRFNQGVTIFIEPVAKTYVSAETAIVPISSLDDFRYEAGFILNSKQKVQKYTIGLLIDFLTRHMDEFKNLPQFSMQSE